MGEWRDVFDIKRDSAPVEEIAARIDADSTVKGANLVILIMAIFIASVGLNMNSVAVIIGLCSFRRSWAASWRRDTAWRRTTCVLLKSRW